MKFYFGIRLLFAFLVLCVILVTCTLTSCEILKNKQSNASDSTSVKKKNINVSSDSSGGFVSKNETKSKGEYERVTTYYQRPDTNIINLKFNTPQPYVVVTEKGSNEHYSNTVDSGWYRLIEQKLIALSDSMNKKEKSESKQTSTETKGVGLWTVIMIVGAAFVAMKLLGYSMSNFKIVKRK